jgi:hypothetical protein
MIVRDFPRRVGLEHNQNLFAAAKKSHKMGKNGLPGRTASESWVGRHTPDRADYHGRYRRSIDKSCVKRGFLAIPG